MSDGVLLDTNALLWVLTGDPRLGPVARERLLADGGRVHHSVVSVLELTIKDLLGRLALPPDLPGAIGAAGTRELAFTSAHALRLTDLPTLVRHDPFDRMLLAQASVEGLELLTADAVLLGLGLDGVTDARR